MPRAAFPEATLAKVARLRQENPLGMSVQLRLVSTLALFAAAAAPPAAAARDRAGDGLLFRVSGDNTLIADEARGAAIPNFESAMSIVPDGAIGSAIRWSDGGYVAWQAPGNMYAQREIGRASCRERVCQYV